MIDKLRSHSTVNRAPINKAHKKQKVLDANTISNTAIDMSIVDTIVNELINDRDTTSVEDVQKMIIYTTLSKSLGEKATQEVKFKELFNYVNEQLSQDDKVQKLIKRAIDKHLKIKK